MKLYLQLWFKNIETLASVRVIPPYYSRHSCCDFSLYVMLLESMQERPCTILTATQLPLKSPSGLDICISSICLQIQKHQTVLWVVALKKWARMMLLHSPRSTQSPSGCPLKPCVQLLFADEETSTWEWLRRPPANSDVNPHDDSEDSAWHLVSNAHVYTPGREDVGQTLKMRCTPAEHR